MARLLRLGQVGHNAVPEEPPDHGRPLQQLSLQLRQAVQARLEQSGQRGGTLSSASRSVRTRQRSAPSLEPVLRNRFYTAHDDPLVDEHLDQFLSVERIAFGRVDDGVA